MLQVLCVASEIFPVIKTGGLADVVGALPAAMRAQEVKIRTLVPGYPAVPEQLVDVQTVWSDADYFGGEARLLEGRAHGLDLFVLDAPHLYGRPGNPYISPDGNDWPDNPQRFAALAYAASLIGHGAVADYVPDVVHGHDWQAGLAPAYLALAGGPRPATVITVHNLAFQGQVPATLLASLRLPASAYTKDGVEYYGAIGMLKAGLVYADKITTVSPTYAADLKGILNGIDTTVWDPATDTFLPTRYMAPTRGRRSSNKIALQKRLGLKPGRETLLFGVVSRLSDQKGLDLLLPCLPDLLGAGAQLAMLGSGDPWLQTAFAAAATANPGRIAVELGYDEGLAHLLQGGCDAILVPSRFEPCGLTQLYALRYGAIPVVSRVGGLADTIIDANPAALAANVATGVQFNPGTAHGLRTAILRTAALWKQRDVWSRMQLRGMRSDVGWGEAAVEYAAVYRAAVGGRK
jgi:starch synthase